MVFIGHFLLLLFFMLLLYSLSNYSSLRYEIKELSALQTRLKTLSDPQQRQYYKNLYNENCEAYQRRKASIFSRGLIFFFKNLNQNFSRID